MYLASLKGETESVMLIEPVLLVVFANLPAWPALAAHKFMLNFLAIAAPQHRTNEPRKNAPDREE
jgi:hypothetical protein